MGIPYYFSYLVKNNPELLVEFQNLNKKVDNFYLDCNSIIYDNLRNIEYDNNNSEYEMKLIVETCNKINEYIEFINPSKQVIIAFDGVAPVAKLNQQRNRRHKSCFEKEVISSFKNNDSWPSLNITPGTSFMKKLNNQVKKYFKQKKYKAKCIIYASDEPGEGEHKLFEFIRKNPTKHNQETTLIYGIDADLIMLSLYHHTICKNIYLYRETPYFIKSINKSLEPDKCYIMHIPRLANEIIRRMNDYKEYDQVEHKNRLYDYLLLCFLLGNDFMPHCPYINIRTNGIDILMKHYLELFKNTKENLSDGKKINWVNLKKLFAEIIKHEKIYLLDEFQIRKKMEKRPLKTKTIDDKLEYMNHIPYKNRNNELLIHPNHENWKKRYYKYLFQINNIQQYKRKICTNYFEALEWTFKYYTDSCYDWRWCYQYHYSPLFSDLIHYIPDFNTPFVEKKPKNPISSKTQLAYVIPEKYNSILEDSKIIEKINKNRELFYSDELCFHWEFCKYFWEGHIELPQTNIDTIENVLS